MGSVSIEQIERRTTRQIESVELSTEAEPCRELCPPFEMVNAGDHWSLRMSRQIDPFELMFGW